MNYLKAGNCTVVSFQVGLQPHPSISSALPPPSQVMSYPGLSRVLSRRLGGGTGSGTSPVIGLSFELKVLEICLDSVSVIDGCHWANGVIGCEARFIT